MSDDEDWAKMINAQEQGVLHKQIKDLQIHAGQGDSNGVGRPAVNPPGASGGMGRGRPVTGSGTLTIGASSSPQVSSPSVSTVSSPSAPAADGGSKAGGSATNKTEEDEPEVSPADASLINKILRSQLVSTKSDIEILRNDPNSPLFHVKNFKDLRLKPELLRGIYDMGFNAPSKIQETALPALLADPPTNMIAQSQSGTGKTAAFVLTMLSRVDPSKPYPQCICLAPTYELALQIGDVTKKMSQHMSTVSVCFAIRGETTYARGESITDHIIIGTPGTMFDWCAKFKRFDLQKVNVFVLDEADVMIDKQGHADQSIRIQKLLRKDCQLLLFSATYDDPIMKFAMAIVSNPMIIRLKREEESLDNIRQFYIECRDQTDKFEALSNIYGSITIGQSMIFCHTRRIASWLTEQMTKQGHAVALLTGELDVKMRADIIGRFRAGKEKVLITTNVSARGIDVDQVTVVVNFDLPVDQMGQVDCETYLHRIGRTGRFGKSGLAINMVDSSRTKAMLATIEKHFGRKIAKLNAENPDDIEKISNVHQ